MNFSDRLKEKRLEANLSQLSLSKTVGISHRTIQNYECGISKPQSLELVQKLAKTLNTSVEYLIDGADMYVIAAHEKAGAKAAKDINELVTEVSGLFAGGTLDDASIDGAMKALNDAYWLAKEKNKKYTPKKYRQGE